MAWLPMSSLPRRRGPRHGILEFVKPVKACCMLEFVKPVQAVCMPLTVCVHVCMGCMEVTMEPLPREGPALPPGSGLPAPGGDGPGVPLGGGPTAVPMAAAVAAAPGVLAPGDVPLHVIAQQAEDGALACNMFLSSGECCCRACGG